MAYKNIKEIEKYFLCCHALKSPCLEDGVFDTTYCNLEGQKLLLEHTVNHPLVKQMPVHLGYAQHFLKALITQLERQGHEVLDEVYTTYCELLSTSDLGIHYRHYILNNDKVKAISLEESNCLISCGTTGLCTWQASIALAEWSLKEIEFLRGKRVLELGSGIGLTGLVIALCCETQCFCFSDAHPLVLQILKSNIHINLKQQTLHRAFPVAHGAQELSRESDPNISDSDIMLSAYLNGTAIHVLNLPWEDVDKNNALQKLEPFDIILAADVVYDSSIFEDLCRALWFFVSKGHCIAFLACTIRNKDTLDAFLELLGSKNLKIKELMLPKADNFIYSNEVPIVLYKISTSR